MDGGHSDDGGDEWERLGASTTPSPFSLRALPTRSPQQHPGIFGGLLGAHSRLVRGCSFPHQAEFGSLWASSSYAAKHR